MTNDVNHNPANDPSVRRLGIAGAEDTEGHVRARSIEEADTEIRAGVEDADTEGHIRARTIDEADTDAEFRAGVEDADTEGHLRH